MATIESPTPKRPVPLPAVINERLEEVRRRESMLRLKTGLVDALALFLAVMFIALVIDWSITLFSTAVRQTLTYVSLGIGAFGLLVLALLPQFRRRSLSDLAADVDRSVSGLDERWQTVTEITTADDPRPLAGSPAMFQKVVSEAVASEIYVEAADVVSPEKFKKHRWLLAAAVASHLLLFAIDAPQAWVLVRRFVAPASPMSLTQLNAIGGDLVVPRGEPIRLEATVTRRPCDSAQLFLRDAAGQETTMKLARSQGDGAQFVHAIAAVQEPFSYRFRAGDAETEWHQVTVHDRPKLTNLRFHLESPQYTGLPVVEKSELPAKIRAVEGSTLELEFQVDQPLDRFQLEFGKDERVEISPDGSDPLRYVFRTKLDKTIRFAPVFISRHGLENLRIPSCQVVVYPDQAPQVTIITPEKEITVRPNDKVEIELNARDDFGVARAELIVYVGDAPDMQNAVVLPAQPAGETAATQNQNGANTSAADTKAAPAGENAPKPSSENQAATTGKSMPDTTRDKSVSGKSESDGTTPSPDKTSPAAEKTSSTDKQSATDKVSAADSSKTSDKSGTQMKTSPAKSNNAGAAGKTGKSNDSNKPDGSNSAGSKSPEPAGPPPKTAIMPIPLADQAGGKNLRSKVTLDLSKFQLKQGEQLQYMVKVYDSRNTGSTGQTYAGSEKPRIANNALAKADAQTDPSKMASSSPQGNSPQGKSNSSPDGSQQGAPQGSNSESQMSKDRQNQAATASVNSSEAPRNPQAGSSQSNSATKTMTSPRNPSQGVAKVSPRQTPPAAGDSAQSSSSGENKPQDSSNQQASSGQSSSQSGEPNSGKQKSQPADEPQGQMTGAGQPNNPLTRRKLDVESQSTSSSTMKIHIDQWAGSFESQKREKLELLIDPVLKELDAALARALEHLKPVTTALAESKPMTDEHKKSLRAADTQIERGQSLVGDLVKKSDGTPYAFIGLQLVDITEQHISPAHVDLKAAHTDAAEKQPAHVQQAEFHVQRARELLADLTRTYENVKRNVRLAEDMQRIKNMYQSFVEDSLAMLGSSKPELNERGRKMAELELDQEFLDKYNELQKRWQKILAELAKALAKDPRLLERYMSKSRQSVDTLRDQLTILNNRQKELLPPVEQLIRSPLKPAEKNPVTDKPSADSKNTSKDAPAVHKAPTGAEAAVRSMLVRDMAEIAASATAVQEDLTTWLPRNLDPNDARFAKVREQAVLAAAAAGKAAAEASKPDDENARDKQTKELATQLKSFEESLVVMAKGDDARLVEHLNRRLARVRGMQQKLSAWTEKSAHLKNSQLHRALEVDQHRLAEDTLTLVDKLGNLEAQLAGMPDEVLKLGDELQDIMRYDVLVDEMSAELKLRDADLPEARDHQKKALEGLARAEAQFDKLIDGVIAEQDKVPPQVPDIDNMQLPTLEELLAQLEAEQDLAESLGIPQRPTNLQQLQSWLLRSRGGQGMGSGMASSGMGRAQMLERAKQDALRSIRNASKVEGARPNGNQARRWNTLASRLDDVLRQGRGNTPPKQYRKAIERYFELISGAGESKETPVPAPAKNNKAAAP